MSLQNKKNNESGFTIIEVVLVLAIAGLIFLIVFLALPQLQKSRRDTQRKNDAGRVLANLEQYAANSNGDYPENQGEFEDYFVDYFECTGTTWPDDTCPNMKDPQSGDIEPIYATADTTSADPGAIYMAESARCEDNEINVDSSFGSREIAILVHQESGGTFCQDNQ